ncbi:MAG: biopolymer transporter ExbD [Bacteroidetes bacterium]|jgi:biopolymer transport protein ExbD|nr:biopolymer transporter ExbD [Bacteroidota bacterium]
MEPYDSFDEFPNPIQEGRKQQKAEKQTVFTDMNAMVDLAFLLLTFFMLTTTMVKPKVMEIVMPVPSQDEKKEDVQPIKESRAISLLPLSDGRLYIYKGLSVESVQKISYKKEGLRATLQEILPTIDKPIIIIKPHPACNFRNLVDVLDEMNVLKVERYAIDEFSEKDRNILEEAGVTKL